MSEFKPTHNGIIKFKDPTDSAGFFSNYFSVLSTIHNCLINNLYPYVDATQTWFNPAWNHEKNLAADPTINPWNWWFDQTIIPSFESKEVWIDRSNIIHVPKYFIQQPSLDYFRKIASTFCKFKPYITNRIEAIYKKRLANKCVLGILARGTENLLYHPEYPKVNTKEWPQIIKVVLESMPEVDTIFLVSDDLTIVRTVTDSFDNVEYLEDFFRCPVESDQLVHKDPNYPWWLDSNDGHPNHRQRVGEECLIQIMLLSRCDYFLGVHSGLSNGALFFNSNKFKKALLV